MPKDPSIDRLEVEVKPTPKLEKRTRRAFPADCKLRIIREADTCKHGEIGPLLRREKLYSNHFSEWRREFAEIGIAGLEKSAAGPTAQKTPQERVRSARLKNSNNRLIDRTISYSSSKTV